MKRKIWLITSCALLVMVLLSAMVVGCAEPASEPSPTAEPTPTVEVIELNFANFFPPVAKMSTLGEDFIAEIDSRTNGQVKITYFPGGSLLGPPDMFDGVTTGIADIGWSHVGYYRDLFPMTELLTLPMGFPSGWVDTHVVNDFYQQYQPAEWDDNVHVILFAGTGPKVIHTKGTAVRVVEDLKGQQIRAPGLAGDVITALGGSPVPTAMPEAYEAVSKGVLDGVHLPFEALKSWRISEVTKYSTNCWQIGEIDVFFLVMNKDKWDSLPADVQKVFDDVSAEYIEMYAQAWNDLDFVGREDVLEKGNEIIELSDEEAARWVDAVNPVLEAEILKRVAAGYSEAEVRGWIDYITERIDYWTAKQAENGIQSVTGPAELR
jgi:TRAP-type transport system periplasmic protein